MEVIALPRGGGKSTKLINLALKNNGILVVNNKHRRDMLHQKHKNLNVITYSDFLDKSVRTNPYNVPQHYYIDDVEFFLQRVFSTTASVVSGFSCSTEETNTGEFNSITVQNLTINL